MLRLLGHLLNNLFGSIAVIIQSPYQLPDRLPIISFVLAFKVKVFVFSAFATERVVLIGLLFFLFGHLSKFFITIFA